MISVEEISKLKEISFELRKSVIKMLAHAKSGHPAGSLGMADIFSALYFKFLKINPKNPHELNRDRLILSNGHICPILYSAMAKKGFFPEFWTEEEIPEKIKEFVKRVVPEKYSKEGKYVTERGRILVDDEYMIPDYILKNDPLFKVMRN